MGEVVVVFTGLHGMIGLLVSNLTIQSSSKQAQTARWAIVVGSILPDIDIFGSIIIYLVTFNVDQTIGFHRTITHSYIVLGLILIVGILLYKLPHNRFELIGSFLVGYSLGGIIHSFFDLLYFDGVALLWPLSKEKGWNLLGITYEHFPDIISKVLLTIDTFFEPFFWLLLSYLAIKHGTNNSITLGKKRISNVPKKLQIISYLTLPFIPLYLFIAFYIPMSLEFFVIVLYIAGMFVLGFSMLIVFLMKNTLEQVSFHIK